MRYRHIHQVLSSSCDGRPFGYNRHRPKRGDCCAPFGGGTGFPSNTIWPGPRPTPVPSGILNHPGIWPQQTWAENGGCAPLGGAGSASSAMSPGPRSTSLPSGILIHPAVWAQQTWADGEGLSEPESPSNTAQCRQGRGLPPNQVSS